MGLIAEWLGGGRMARNADDERWWGTADGGPTDAGVVMNADAALKISTVYACVRLLAEAVASLPLNMYRRRDDGGRELQPRHPLQFLLHDQANENNSAFEFREMLMGHALVRGNGYARIIPGPRGAVDQLEPWHPDRVEVETIPGGRRRYKVLRDDGGHDYYNQEDVFHLRGLSFDGVTGVSIIEYARNSFGLALAAESYGSKFFGNDSRPGGVLSTDSKLNQEVADRIKASWEAAHKRGNNHRVAILEQGLQWQQVGIAPEDAQFLGTREFQAEDIAARWFGVPPHMVGLTAKATSWGSGIEQMSIGFVTYTLLPWLKRWTQAIDRDLVIAPETYFAQFVVNGLVRGDMQTRTNAYALGRQWGWLSVNDIRAMEDMNPVENGDVYLQPLNMVEAGTPQTPDGAAGALEMQPHYQLLLQEAAARVVRKEAAALGKAAKRCMSEDGYSHKKWYDEVEAFYGEHADFVAETLRISKAAADRYVAGTRGFLWAQGPDGVADLETVRLEALMGIVYEEQGNE